MLYAAWVPVTAFAVSLILVWCLATGRLGRMVVDLPNERSLHSAPTPRNGGWGLHAGVLSAWPLCAAGIPTSILVSLVALLIVSAVDDIRGLPVIGRLAVHLLAAGTVATDLLLQDFGLLSVVIAALGIVWMTNLYNFMDGSDGLAGGMTLLGFSCYGLAAYIAGNTAFAMLNFSIAAAAAAFLLFNYHPARIFLGDAGSIPLGFLAGALGLFGWAQDYWPWWFPMMVFSPFIADASVTLARRAFAGAAIWQAHRDHNYQRLVRMGWGHRRTALAAYVLMVTCGTGAIAGLRWSAAAQLALLASAALIYAALMVSIEITWRNSEKARRHDD